MSDKTFSLVVHGAPFTSQASYTALQFAKACIDAGHSLYRVFFYQDGVLNGNSLLSPPQDELNQHASWAALQANTDCELTICIAAAARRGMIDESEAQRHEHEHFTIPKGFELAGLGQLVDACIHSDRVINFGAARG